MTYKQLAKELGVSYPSAIKYAWKNNIQIYRRPHNYWAYVEEKIQLSKALGYDHPDDLIRDCYYKMSSRDIAKLLEVTQSAINKHLHRLKLKVKPRGGANYSPRKEITDHKIVVKGYRRCNYICGFCKKEIVQGDQYYKVGRKEVYHVECAKERRGKV